MASLTNRVFAHQRCLFGDTPELEKIINVASVAQLSPFRYPGGKTWLVPRICRWLRSKPKSKHFIEPFAGGGIVSLTVADQGLAEHVIMVEKDEEVAAVWRTIFSDKAEWLADEIMGFDLVLENVVERLSGTSSETHEIAFRTILKNRTYHGGILAPGSALIKKGENGKGISSRWYPTTLKNRIMRLHPLRDRITFVQGDGLEIMKKYSDEKSATFFIDPPYSAPGKKAGSRLYRHFQLDHDLMFRLTSDVKGDFLMTYDNATSVHEMAARHRFDTRSVAMKNTHHAEMTELLIGRDLSWCDGL